MESIRRSVFMLMGKRICMVSSRPGTLWAFYKGLIERLKSLSVDVVIATSDLPHLRCFNNQLNCSILPVEISRMVSPVRDLFAICRLVRYLRASKYDIVHAHTPKGGLIGMISAFLAGVRARVYTMHGLVLETATGFKRKLLWCTEWLNCKIATEVLAVSPSVREVALEEGLCRPEKVRVICNGTACGVDLQRF